VSVGVTVCSGTPIPFDEIAIDRELEAAHTLQGIAATANKVVFDLYDRCAFVMRFFVVDDGEPRLVKVTGDRRLAPNRDAVRRRAIDTGHTAIATLGRPAGFDLGVAPLRDRDLVIGLLEFVVPSELVSAKAARLALVTRTTSSSLRAWRRDAKTQRAASQAAGSSFALGLRLAGVLSRAGELGAGLRGAVELLARELKSPVVAWRADPAVESMRMAASSGLAGDRRQAVGSLAVRISPERDRKHLLLDLRDRVAIALRTDVTVIDGGTAVFVAGGRHAELELCGHELRVLLDQLPAASVSTLEWDGDHSASRPWALESIERTRLADLTPREREILVLLARGARSSEIAQRLVISEKTVKTHIQNILRKLEVTSRLEAAAVAVRAGFVPLSAS
jgi:DNA-binding CsgD family transcriptional regulator